jgi:dihydrofolate reductase
MPKLRVNCFSISLDGYGAGPRQDLDNPLGAGGVALHEWVFPTTMFKAMQGDNDFAERGMSGLGAWILGRNMFSPYRGSWRDDSWKGWWGDNPPYHTPVFVLTNYAREPLGMEGGTTFHFVTGGIRDALERAQAAAGPKDIRVGGGVATIREYIQAGLVDEMHLVISPVLLGSGEHLLHGLDLPGLGFECKEHVPTKAATHVVLARKSRVEG